ncbi:hypothetical protein [Saccharothrix lopnurensis]|uniref:Tissue inhibitor of metalloproteinase n=1 Tax=Saccharothrix lopnurensis TaxID=1670621 RepID=A0ABW1NZS5_9PSEU
MARLRLFAHTAGVLTATATLIAAVLTSPASACSCVPGDTEPQRYQRANHVFSGTVVASETEANDPSTVGDDRYRYRVEVDVEYKGDVPPMVDVLTSVHSSTCGTTLAVGTEYLVFAFGDSSDARVDTHSCSGTRHASGGPPTSQGPTGSSTTPTCSTPTP